MAHAKTSLRTEQRALRDRMRAAGMSHQQIAVEFVRRYGLRPRAAWRNAHGWSQTEAAEQINRRAGDTGLDPSGTAAMTPHPQGAVAARRAQPLIRPLQAGTCRPR